MDELRWLKPVRPGDTLSIRVTLLEAQRSRSKPDQGFIRGLTEVLNQHGEVVMTMKSGGFIRCREGVALLRMAINRGIRRVDTGQSGCEASTLTRTALKGVSRDFKPNLNRGGIMEEKPRIGSRVIGTIKGVKGSCSAGHREMTSIDLSGHDTGGLCGFLYHQAFPYIPTLQFGWRIPA